MKYSIALTVTEGEDQGKSFRLTKPRTVIGRQGADFCLEDKKISSMHAAIEISDQDVAIVDLDSRNGVLVNGEKTRKTILSNMDEIQLGLTKLKILIVADLQNLRTSGKEDAEVTSAGKDIGAMIDDELKGVSKWDLAEPTESTPEGQSFKAVAYGIEIVEGPDAGKKFSLEKSSTSLGRGKADIVFSDSDISRLHALLEVNRVGQVTIRDMGSTNGTYVNAKRVAEAKLSSGDTFQMGGTLCRLVRLT
ncbi:MAG TPA: FHA domain-containing protein [Bdellovibrionota bacterium]|nr:FHA domain-containing protein [Bdellovibrionota bacterium]